MWVLLKAWFRLLQGLLTGNSSGYATGRCGCISSISGNRQISRVSSVSDNTLTLIGSQSVSKNRILLDQPVASDHRLCGNATTTSRMEMRSRRDIPFASVRITHGPKRRRYSLELMKAFTISAAKKSPLKAFSLFSQKL